MIIAFENSECEKLSHEMNYCRMKSETLTSNNNARMLAAKEFLNSLKSFIFEFASILLTLNKLFCADMASLHHSSISASIMKI
jgi:SMC interacting uncharacterized protein involved in chromosome segregation